MKGWDGSRLSCLAVNGKCQYKWRYGDTNLYFREGIGSSWGSLQKIWTSGNDGTGSGLDADTVDGIQASTFLEGLILMILWMESSLLGELLLVRNEGGELKLTHGTRILLYRDLKLLLTNM